MSGPHKHARRRWRAPLAAVALALALPTAAHAAPLALVDQSEPIGPGITLRHQKTLETSGWVDSQVLTADLSNAAVSSDLLHADKVAQGSALSTSTTSMSTSRRA